MMPPPPPAGRGRRGGPQGLMALALLLIAIEGLVVTYVVWQGLKLLRGRYASGPPVAPDAK